MATLPRELPYMQGGRLYIKVYTLKSKTPPNQLYSIVFYDLRSMGIVGYGHRGVTCFFRV